MAPPFDDDVRDCDPLPLCARLSALQDRLAVARGEELHMVRAEMVRLEQRVSAMLRGTGTEDR